MVRIGATGLAVGFEHSQTGEDGQTYTNLFGNPVDKSALDVIVNRYETFVT